MATKTKILYVITKGNWGGAQRYVFDVATNLPREEFDVVVAMGDGSVLEEKLTKAGIRTIRLGKLREGRRAGPQASDLSSFFELISVFRRERPDIIHLNSSRAALLGALAARVYSLLWLRIKDKVRPNDGSVGRGLKIVFTVHGWPFLERRSLLARTAIWFASYLTALLSHVVIVVSEHDLKGAQRLPHIGGKTVRIYNGIAPVVLGSPHRVRSAFPNGARITGTIGELTRNKNHEALIEAARKDPDMFVAIVGEGELRQKLEALIQKYGIGTRVKLFGFLPAHEALRGFDVFAFPSLKEGLPYALLEAKAAGLPIVANRVGGVGEILDNTNPETFTLEEMLRRTLHVYSSMKR